MIPFLLSVICLVFIVIQGGLALRYQALRLPALIDDMAFLGPYSAQSVALSDITMFHQVSFYAPRQVARGAVYVADPAYSVRYIRQDTIDRGLLDLRPWFPLNVVEYAQYAEAHPQFLIYGSVGEWNWITFVAAPPAYRTELLERSGANLFLRVQRTVPVPESPQPDLHRDDSRYLFSHVRATGPSLCEEWFPGDSFCTEIEQNLRERRK